MQLLHYLFLTLSPFLSESRKIGTGATVLGQMIKPVGRTIWESSLTLPRKEENWLVLHPAKIHYWLYRETYTHVRREIGTKRFIAALFILLN